jgi:hypothetical protein
MKRRSEERRFFALSRKSWWARRKGVANDASQRFALSTLDQELALELFRGGASLFRVGGAQQDHARGAEGGDVAQEREEITYGKLGEIQVEEQHRVIPRHDFPGNFRRLVADIDRVSVTRQSLLGGPEVRIITVYDEEL